MKGTSARVSRTLSHLDLPRVMYHAKGTPAMRSKAETIRAIMKEFEIAAKASPIKAGWSKTFWIVSNLMNMPTMGGIKIKLKNTMTADR